MNLQDLHKKYTLILEELKSDRITHEAANNGIKELNSLAALHKIPFLGILPKAAEEPAYDEDEEEDSSSSEDEES